VYVLVCGHTDVGVAGPVEHENTERTDNVDEHRCGFVGRTDDQTVLGCTGLLVVEGQAENLFTQAVIEQLVARVHWHQGARWLHQRRVPSHVDQTHLSQ